MINKWAKVERMLVVSLAFTVALIIFRIITTGKVTFLYFTWNLFLASLPLLMSRVLIHFHKVTPKVWVILGAWLLVLPNAPYLITDIIHFTERPPVSKWFDLLLVTSAAWNGLILGVVSLMQVENFLQKQLSAWKLNLLMFCTIFICSYGIYLGRFLRYNSWDVVTDPSDLLHQIGRQMLRPKQHFNTWAFTLLFGAMFWIFYYTIRQLPYILKPVSLSKE